MMGYRSRKIAFFILPAILMVAAALISMPVEARDPRPIASLPDINMVSGEPGEDPHLKTIPTIYIVQESAPLGAAGEGGPVLLDECSIHSEGLREGNGRVLGSRVNRAWWMLLRTWLWHMHR